MIDFLNAVLDFPKSEKIVQVQILNPHQAPKIEALKETLLDIKATDEKGRSFIVEMQVERQQAFGKRALYYSSSTYTRQLNRGGDYGELKKVYFVGILDFIAIDNTNWLSNHLILDKKTGENFIKDFEFSFVELPKFKLSEKELWNVVEKWIYFVKHLGTDKDEELDYKHLFRGESAILEALDIAQEHNLNEEELEIYDYRERVRMNEYKTMRTAIMDGMEKGIEK